MKNITYLKKIKKYLNIIKIHLKLGSFACQAHCAPCAPNPQTVKNVHLNILMKKT